MSAPATDLPSSISSSGHHDGLGRRLLAFDRETGAIRERLYLRPELSAFQAPLRRRVEVLSAFEDERFARPCAVERDPRSGELTVLSEFIAGSRLSDLIETAQEAAIVPGVDAALGFLLEALPAISSFHSVLSISHGLVDPTRIAVTPAGQVVFLDTSFGEIVERLALSPARLWAEFGIAAPAASGRLRLDAAMDVRQIALNAIALLLGRRVRLEESQNSFSGVLDDVGDVAQIRGTPSFAAGLQRIVRDCLLGPGASPRRRIQEITAEIRDLVARDIGEDVCHRALREFVEAMDAHYDATSVGAPRDQTAAPSRALVEPAQHGLRPDTTASPSSGAGGLNGRALGGLAAHTSLHDVAPGEDSAVERSRRVPDSTANRVPSAPAGAPQSEVGAGSVAPVNPAEPVDAAPVGAWPMQETAASSAPASVPDAPPSSLTLPADAAAGAPVLDEAEEQAPAGGADASASRRKRQQRSPRERKDRLRSTSTDVQTAPRSSAVGAPDRAGAFESVPRPPQDANPAGVPATDAAPAVIPLPVFPPLPVTSSPAAGAHPATPIATPPAGVRLADLPVPITPAAPQARRGREARTGTVLRIKTEPPPGFKPPRVTETVSSQPYVPQGPLFGSSEPARFPARLAVILLAMVAVAVLVGRIYLPGASEAAPPAAPAAPQEPPVVQAPAPETGEIVVRSQPDGVRVLLDGKPVGETPLRMTGVAAGRHVLTFASETGEVTRAVKVNAGQAIEVEAPVYSGFLAVFAPIVLDVSVNGRSVGTTEQSRLLLPPGRHKLTLANREIGYRAVQTVQIEPGEVASLTLEPTGRVNLNANPWAEVWLEGRRLGDTPIADVRIPLGVREFVFRHPQLGERKTTAIVRGDQPTAVSVDFTRSDFE